MLCKRFCIYALRKILIYYLLGHKLLQFCLNSKETVVSTIHGHHHMEVILIILTNLLKVDSYRFCEGLLGNNADNARNGVYQMPGSRK